MRFSGCGEPLVNKNIAEMIAYACDKGIAERLEIITNGSLLYPDLKGRKQANVRIINK